MKGLQLFEFFIRYNDGSKSGGEKIRGNFLIRLKGKTLLGRTYGRNGELNGFVTGKYEKNVLNIQTKTKKISYNQSFWLNREILKDLVEDRMVKGVYYEVDDDHEIEISYMGPATAANSFEIVKNQILEFCDRGKDETGFKKVNKIKLE